MGSDHDLRLHSSYGRGLARDQAFVAKRNWGQTPASRALEFVGALEECVRQLSCIVWANPIGRRSVFVRVHWLSSC